MECKSIKEICDRIEIWTDWLRSYNKWVPRFIEEAKTGKDWSDWNKDTFYEFFERSSDQCVASLKQGYFTNAEKSNIKKNWSKLSPLLRILAENQDNPDWDSYFKIKALIRKYTTNDRKAGTNRLIAALQPKLLSTIVTEGHLKELYDRIKQLNSELLPAYERHNWFKNSNNILKLLNSTMSTNESMNIVTYSWQLLEYFRNHDDAYMKKQAYIDQFSNLFETKGQIILQGAPGTGKTYIAKDIAEKLIFGEVSTDKEVQEENLAESDNFKLIQFHPAYTYEDFVRGISSKVNDDNQVFYKTENKVLAEFAEKSFKNYLNYHKSKELLTSEFKFDSVFKLYLESLDNRFVDGKVFLNNSRAFIKQILDDSFCYYHKDYDQSGSGFHINFERVKELFLCADKDNFPSSQKFNNSTRLKVIKELLIDFKLFYDAEEQKIEEQEKVKIENYVLIVDEINRANLPAVLGELIYALEYRGKPVESMYELDGNREIVLPPNLFIIGTMNTADRSVGHIDYAIRRRFAYVSMLPKRSIIKEIGSDEAVALFDKIATLFVKKYIEQEDILGEPSEYLSPEFKAEDVMIGHSYFLEKNPKNLKVRLQYEIKPILREYLKDGVLLDNAKAIIDAL